MKTGLSELFARLDGYADPIHYETLTQHVRAARINIDDVRPFVRFSSEKYQRNLIHTGPAYEALILCWRAGQQSAIHDHEGSACCVRVLEGTATETVYDTWAGNIVYPVSTRQFYPGDVCGSFDSDIHSVANRQMNGADLVTLHIYSKPLQSMNRYELADPNVLRLMQPAGAYQATVA